MQAAEARCKTQQMNLVYTIAGEASAIGLLDQELAAIHIGQGETEDH